MTTYIAELSPGVYLSGRHGRTTTEQALARRYSTEHGARIGLGGLRLKEARVIAIELEDGAAPVVFPPMDPNVFAAKIAKWQKREPRQFRPATKYGRPSSKRIPVDKFVNHIEAVTRGRFKARNAAREQRG